MKTNLFYLLICLLLCSSCATILNGSHAPVKIYAPQGSTIEHNKTVYNTEDGYVKLHAKRSTDSLKFSLKNDSITSSFSFKSKWDFLVYLNIVYNYGLGIPVDLISKKGYSYKRNLRFEIDSTNSEFYISKEKIDPFKQNTIFVYTSSLQALDPFSEPMLTLGAEYFFLDGISLSAEYGTVYLKSTRYDKSSDIFEKNGQQFRTELKFYGIGNISGPRVNEYLGLEFRSIYLEYGDDISYFVTPNEEVRFYKNEDILVQKRVNIYNLKYGLNFPIGKQFYLDVYSGLGIRTREFKNPNRFYNPDIHEFYENDKFSFFIDNNNLERKKTHLNFSLGFKFGVKF